MELIKLFTDGAARGNPGPAGIGVAIIGHTGSVVVECSEYIGETTNNIAEYRAFIRGLQEATALSPAEVHAFCDSQLLVRQVKGEYKVRHENLIPLYQEALALIRQLPRFQITYIPRSENKYADALANQGIDSHQCQ
ncbi:MAG: ribonuclease HI family protein [bacterium]